jgi:hypothetical protein
MQFYTVEDIGNTRGLTPEGFLLCRDVPIARVGTQLYGPGETPLEPGPDGVVYIDREPEEVFRPETIGSFAGKAVVNEHPMDEYGVRCDVTPANWRELVVGVLLNPRQGIGLDEDVLLADLLITDPLAMDLIGAGKVQVSCGYSADYEELGPGRGRQVGIIGNHIALVDQGRCGPRCAIGDAPPIEAVSHDTPSEGEGLMLNFLDLLRRARKATTDQEFEKVLEQAGELGLATSTAPAALNGAGSTVHVHVGTRDEDKEDKEDKDDKTGDQGVAGMMGRHDAELEELWQANEAERAVIESLASGGGQDGRPKFRDSFPHRDARRTRMGIRHSRDNGENPFEKTDDQGAEGGFRDPGAVPSNSEGTVVLPGFEIEAPPGTSDQALRQVRDSALFEDSFQETIARAEILVPGIALPTFDRAAKPKATFDALCALRAKVLDLAWAQPDTRELIAEATGGSFPGSSRGMKCDMVRHVFFAASAMKRRQNSAGRATDTREMMAGGFATVGPIQSPDDLNRIHTEFYAAQRRH